MSLRSLRPVLVLGALALAAAAPAAQAFQASIISTVNMRAGPSVNYPQVALLGPGTYVEVFGCEQGYGWCDVQAGPNRGWVAADYLQAIGPSGPVVIAGAGALLALPIITFSFGTYWDTWYRGRPWYGRRPYYYNYWNRYPHGRPPPPPMHRPPGWRPPPPPPPRPPPRPPSHGRPPGGKPPPPAPGPKPNPRPPGGGRPPPNGGGGGGRPPGGRPPQAQPMPQPQPR